MKPTDERRAKAREEVDLFGDMHRLRSFQNCDANQFSSHARRLLWFLRIIHFGMPSRVSEEMLRIADDVEQNAIQGGVFPHHAAAADAIRNRAKTIEWLECPWAELMPLLQTSPIKNALAQAIWIANKDKRLKWNVPLEKVLQIMGGTDDKHKRKLSTNTSRLVTFLEDGGVYISLSVSSNTSPPIMVCEILTTDQTKIDAVVDAFRDNESSAELSRAHNIREKKAKVSVEPKNIARVVRSRKQTQNQ